MTPDEARARILGAVLVTPQMVGFAKRTQITSAGDRNSADALIEAVLAEHEIRPVSQVIVHDTVDVDEQCAKASSWLSWERAAAEGIWSLVSSGLFFPSNQFSQPRIRGLGWTNIAPGSGSGTAAGWNGFDALNIDVPQQLTRAPSVSGAIDQQLSDADLFLQRVNAPAMHAEVDAALRQSVQCLRHGLYFAALAMLGKASEGAWLELGGALIGMVPGPERATFEIQRRTLDNSYEGLPKKIDAVKHMYAREDLFAEIYARTGIRPKALGSIIQWSDVVRDARNTLHFGVYSATSNDYEKVAVLMLASVVHMQTIYQLVACAKEIAAHA